MAITISSFNAGELMQIKDIRTSCNLTQQQMSELTGIPRRTIEDWEAGRRNPPEWLPKMIQAYLAAKVNKPAL